MAEDVKKKEGEEPVRLTSERPYVCETFGMDTQMWVHVSEYKRLVEKWEAGEKFWRGLNAYGSLVSLRLDTVQCVEMVDARALEVRKQEEKEQNRRYKQEDMGF